MLHKCVALVTSAIKQHQAKGLPMYGPDGELHWVHVCLASYVADIEEQAKLALLKRFPTAFSDASFLVERNDLDNWQLNLLRILKRREKDTILARANFKQSGWDEDCLKHSELPGVDIEVRVSHITVRLSKYLYLRSGCVPQNALFGQWETMGIDFWELFRGDEMHIVRCFRPLHAARPPPRLRAGRRT